MNITIGSTYRNTRKLLRVQYVAIAGAICLAIAAALAGVAGNVELGNGSSAVPSSGTRPVYTTSDLPQVYYYIVNSQEEADTMERAIQETMMGVAGAGLPVPNEEHHFLVADTEEHRQLAQMVFEDINFNQLSGLTTTQVYDLRQP